MSIEPVPHKYAAIINAVQARIEHGVYRPGAMLPSEAELVREFGASRSTVVRALEFLRQHGWLEGVQGKGRLVLGRPAQGRQPAPFRIRRALDLAEAAYATLLHVGPVPAPERIASAFSLPGRARLASRRRRMAANGVPVTTLDVVYLTPDVAQRTGLDSTAPIRDGLLRRLERRGLVPYEVAEQVSARLPTTQEATLLQVGRYACLLASLLVVRDRSGRPLLAMDAVMPAEGSNLETLFGLA